MVKKNTSKLLGEYLDELQYNEEIQKNIRRPGPNPYQGLRFFDEYTSILLTTRDDTSAQIRKRFASEQCVFVIGGSGCGKSSLVRGKILDELRNFSRPIEGRDGDWETCSFRPETNPVKQFADAFWTQIVSSAYQPVNRHRYDLDDPIDAESYDRAEAALAEIRREIGTGNDEQAAREAILLDVSMSSTGSELLHDGFASAYRWVDKINAIKTGEMRPAPANLMIIVDQFEELFRNRVDRQEAQSLCAMIRHAFESTTRQDGVYVAISMRSEDVHRCAEVEGLAEIVNSSVVLVDWLNSEDLHKAIVDPPRTVLANWRITMQQFGTGQADTSPYAPDVVGQIIEEVTWLAHSLQHKSDHLPLLQHGLRELWNVAAERWREEYKANRLESLSIECEDLARLRKRCGLRENSFWLQAQLTYSARRCYAEARKAYHAQFADSKPPVAAAVALRAVLCEMASRDENGKIHRDFADVDAVVCERLLPKDSDAEIDEKRSNVVHALLCALEIFTKHQLLVRLGAKSEPAYDVTHEALIRNWPQMRSWVDEDSELLDAYLNSVQEADDLAADRMPTFKIDKQHVPVLGPTCDWSWSRSIFRSPTFAKFWGLIWPGERQRYGESYSRRWLLRAIQERQTSRDETDNRGSGTLSATEILRGVRRRWRKDLVFGGMQKIAIIFSPFIILALLAWSWTIYGHRQNLAEVILSQAALLTLSNREIDTAPHYEKLKNAEIGLDFSTREPLKISRNVAKSVKFATDIQSLRITLEMLGSIAQVTTKDKLISTENARSKSNSLYFNTNSNDVTTSISNYDRDSLCTVVQNGKQIKTDLFDITIVRGIKSGGGAEIRFHAPNSREHQIPPVSASTLEKVRDEVVRVPENSKELCLSEDGRVAALTIDGVLVPRMFTLDVIRQFRPDENQKHPVIGISINSLQSSWHPEVAIRANSSIRVIGFGSSSNNWTRFVYFSESADVNLENVFVTYFIDGASTPDLSSTAPQDVHSFSESSAAIKGRRWEKIEEDTELECTEGSVYKFKAAPDGILREFQVRTTNVNGLEDVKFVISSNVRENKGAVDTFIRFNVDLHHPLWNCEPLLLSRFVSSPTKSFKVISPSEEDDRLMLYLRDADTLAWRRIILFAGLGDLIELVKANQAAYDDSFYGQGDSYYSRLSAVLSAGLSATEDEAGRDAHVD